MQLIFDVRDFLSFFIVASGNAQEREDGILSENSRTIRDLLITLYITVAVVDLFLEFLSGVITTLDQLKTRVPTGRGVHNVESLNKGMCNGGDNWKKRKGILNRTVDSFPKVVSFFNFSM